MTSPNESSHLSNKLTIRNHEEIPGIWYKDRGGRDNCINIVISSNLEGNKSLQLNENFILKASLVYENYEDIYDPKQSVLSIHPDSFLKVTTNRHGFIKFRIEDVSKNHQSKGFRLKIRIFKKDQNEEVQVLFTDPILVKSKPNIKKKKKIPHKRQRIEVKPSDETLLHYSNLKKPKSSGSLDLVSNWCFEVKNALVELQEIAQRRKSVENRIYNLLESYKTVSGALEKSSLPDSVNQSRSQNVDLERLESLNSVPSLSASTAHMFKGLSTEIMPQIGTSVSLMLSGLQSFQEKQNLNQGKENEVLEASNLIKQLAKEYKELK